MDDPKVAFPVCEKAMELHVNPAVCSVRARARLGEKAMELHVNPIGFQEGASLGPQPIEAMQTWDVDG